MVLTVLTNTSAPWVVSFRSCLDSRRVCANWRPTTVLGKYRAITQTSCHVLASNVCLGKFGSTNGLRISEVLVTVADVSLRPCGAVRDVLALLQNHNCMAFSTPRAPNLLHQKNATFAHTKFQIPRKFPSKHYLPCSCAIVLPTNRFKLTSMSDSITKREMAHRKTF